MQVTRTNSNLFKSLNFKSNSDKNNNPINRQTERNLSIIQSVTGSLIAGATLGGLSSCIKNNKKLNIGIGALAAAMTLILTLPKKIYQANVSSYVSEKDMDSFTSQKEAQKTLYEGVNEQAQGDLKGAVDNYVSLRTADKGPAALMIKGA